MAQTISLVIPAYNEEKYLEACLSAVRKSADDFLEIIVVDNASTDRTRHIAEANNAKVLFEKRKGLTRARQRGYLESTGDIIAYIDADTIIPSNWTAVLREGFNDSTVSMLSGPYVYYDMGPFAAALVKAYWKIAISTYSLTGFLANGGNFAVRRKTLDAIGGFDTDIEFYGEDADIARRVSRVGKVSFRPDFFIYTSSRRFQKEGLLRTAAKYAGNFLSEALIGKPLIKKYTDVR